MLTPQGEEVLEVMANLEMQISRLYDVYGRRFPSHALFWRRLSGEETGHAGLIRELMDAARRGDIMVEEGRFRKEAVQMVLKSLEGHIRDAESGKTDLVNAFSVAAAMENALLEKDFFRIFHGDSSGLRVRLDRLQKDTQNHRILIQGLWMSVRERGGGS